MIRRIAEDIALAATFMTRLPVPCGWIRKERKLAEALWAMPLGGGLIGVLGGGLVIGSETMGVAPGLGSLIALAVMTIATGALHEDGLADFCDGIGGGHSVEQRLEIMRDSQIGTYGTIALILAFVTLVTVMEHLLLSLGAWHLLVIIIAAAALSRSSSAMIFALLPPARNDGLAVFFGHPGRMNLALTLIWPASASIALLGWHAAALITAALLTALTVSAIAYKYLGGYTGDVLGATISLSFVASLVAFEISL